MRLTLSLLAGLTVLAPVAAFAAQEGNPFAPVMLVNERTITAYELSQREKFLEMMSGPGDHTDEAMKGLIDDRLRLIEAARYGIKPTEDEIKAGMLEFAQRGNMTTDQFLQKLQEGGVDPQTFRDFVTAGQAWRDVVRATIAPRVSVTDAEVKDSRQLSLAHGQPRLLISELILPATPEYIGQTAPLAEQLSQTLKGDAAFSAAAQQYSVSDSAKQGGKLDWIPVTNLPQTVVSAVIGLSPGQVSKPVNLPNAIALFELRGLADAPPPPAQMVTVEYLEWSIPDVRTPAGAALAAEVRAKVTTCGDLYGFVKRAGGPALVHSSDLLPKVPADVALELAKLDPGEVSTTLSDGSGTRLLMLCSRMVTPDPKVTEDDLKSELFSAKVNALADARLDQLRAAANIRQP